MRTPSVGALGHALIAVLFRERESAALSYPLILKMYSVFKGLSQCSDAV